MLILYNHNNKSNDLINSINQLNYSNLVIVNDKKIYGDWIRPNVEWKNILIN